MAKVYEQTMSREQMETMLVPYLENNWTWGGGKVVSSSQTYFYTDEAKTLGLYYEQGATGQRASKIGICFKGNNYHVFELASNTTFEIEITDTAMIISFKSGSNSISASDCDKIIICNGHNTNTGEDEQIMIYLGSKSSSNVSSMYASDVATPADVSEQNGNANVNARTTNLIPIYNTNSAFITTDVYKSLCEDIGAWYFGNVMVNGKAYRMSGSVFALDE
ncbi:MAG: hypothetical protein IJJ81_07980 [Ruminococcus sp.]|nr:hypothetical protein [Ruminococcus sp.]